MTAKTSHKQVNTGPNLPSLGVSDKAVLSLLPMLWMQGRSATEMEVAFFITFICLFSPLSFKQEHTVLQQSSSNYSSLFMVTSPSRKMVFNAIFSANSKFSNWILLVNLGS